MSDLFRAYCDVCHEATEWEQEYADAKESQREHWNDQHENNPMMNANMRIQKYDSSEVQDGI